MRDRKSVSAAGGMLVVGIGAGAAFGAACGNLPLGMGIGPAIGLIPGFEIDLNRRRTNGKD